MKSIFKIAKYWLRERINQLFIVTRYKLYLVITIIIVNISRVLGMIENNDVSFLVEDGPSPTFKKLKINKIVSIKQFICYMFYKNNFCFNDISGITVFVRIQTNGEEYFPILEYNFYKFIEEHKLKNQNISVVVCFAGLGGDSWVNDEIMLEVIGDRNHRGRPHIHIKRKDGYSVVAKIYNEKIKFEKKKVWEKKFTRKERKRLEKCISENREKFINFYNKVTYGENPGYIQFYYEGKECCLGFKGSSRYEAEKIWDNGF